MTLDTQFITMLSMVLGGMYLGFATETFRRISVIWKERQALTYLLEIGYWIIQTCILFFLLYQVNDGELRLYIFLACLLGYSIYQVMFKSIYQRVLEFFIKLIVALTRGLIRIIVTLIIRPVSWIVQAAVKVAAYVSRLLYRVLLFVLYVLFYPVRLLLFVLRKLLPERVLHKISKSLSFCSTIINKFKKRLGSLKKWINGFIGRRR